MKTIDRVTIDEVAADHMTITTDANGTASGTTANVTIARVGSARPSEVEFLAAGGIESEVEYEGDARKCPHCLIGVLSIAPEVWAA